MKKVIFCIVIFLNLPAMAIDYDDFPLNMQNLLDERNKELKSNGGICIAGRVTMDDGTHIGGGKDIKVNFCQRVDEHLCVYDDGWFLMDRCLKTDNYKEPAKIVLRAFGYDPIDATIPVLKEKITYVEFTMHKTPPEKLASIIGSVVDEQNGIVDDGRVVLSFPLSYRPANGIPSVSITTDSNGTFRFEDLSITEHEILVGASGCAPLSINVVPSAGKVTTENLTLYFNRKTTIDYVYQADGSRNFTGGNLAKGTIEWINGSKGVDFSDGMAEDYDPQSLRDIEMRQSQNKLSFQNFYVNGKNGFYDAGAVNFNSITEAAETGYLTEARPCVVGHVYVVRTYEDNYAKFVVISISEEEP